MNSIRRLATFFGWCTVINLGILMFAGVVWALAHDGISQVGAAMAGITAEQLRLVFIDNLMLYRAGIFLFNLVPYIALKIMGRSHTGVNP